MNKVVAAFDALKPSKSVMEYAVYLQKKFDAFIIAALLEEVGYRSEPARVNPALPYSTAEFDHIKQLNKKDEKTKKRAIQMVSEYLKSKGLSFKMHTDELLAYESLIDESKFADLILIDDSTSFSNYDKKEPSNFIKHLLSNSKCPVLLVPQSFHSFEKIIIAYDHNESSVYALKEFMHLFPKLNHKSIEIVTVLHDHSSSDEVDEIRLQELLSTKYPAAHHKVIRTEKDDESRLIRYVRAQKENCLLVLGAYNRSLLSMFLKKSTADKLIRDLDIPLFIAHS